jgi:hypothetical protein
VIAGQASDNRGNVSLSRRCLTRRISAVIRSYDNPRPNVRAPRCFAAVHVFSASRTGSFGGRRSVGDTFWLPRNRLSHKIVIMGDPQQSSAVKLVAHTVRGCASLFGSEPIGLRAPETVVHAPSPFLSGGSPRGPSWRGKRLSQSPAPGSWIEASDTEQTHKRGRRVRDRPKTRISGGRGNLRFGGRESIAAFVERDWQNVEIS